MVKVNGVKSTFSGDMHYSAERTPVLGGYRSPKQGNSDAYVTPGASLDIHRQLTER
ncbi:MAG: hypothetical protein ACLVEJ_04885 [Parabacteroides sp.]